MMTDSGRLRLTGLDDDDVESEGELRERPAVGKRARGDHRPRSVAEMAALAVVDGLLGQAEAARPAHPDLDDHEASPSGWARVDGHEVDLVPPDADVPGEDRPALLGETPRDERLGLVAGQLGDGARTSGDWAIHAAIVAVAAYPRITSRSTAAHQRTLAGAWRQLTFLRLNRVRS